MEGHYELVIERLTAAGYRWYETANFCLAPGHAKPAAVTSVRDTTSRTGAAATTSGSGSGAVSTLGGERRRNTPRLNGYLSALGKGVTPEREVELLDESGCATWSG